MLIKRAFREHYDEFIDAFSDGDLLRLTDNNVIFSECFSMDMVL